MSLTILEYNMLKETVESDFKISLSFVNNTSLYFNLKYPTNPILDCQIVNLDNQELNKVVFKFNSLIDEDEFGIVTRIELIKFKNWIIKIVNLKTGALVDL